MTVVARLNTVPQNAEPPDAETSRGLKLNQSAPGGAQCEVGGTPHLATCLGRGKRGVPCPIESFMSARQDMLLAWRRLQPAVSCAALREELRATIRAMRQLMELRE